MNRLFNPVTAAALLLVVACVTLLIASCAPLDNFFIPDPATGVSQADQVGNTMTTVGTAVGGGAPWLEIGAGALSVIGAAYILIRRVQKRIAS